MDAIVSGVVLVVVDAVAVVYVFMKVAVRRW